MICKIPIVSTIVVDYQTCMIHLIYMVAYVSPTCLLVPVIVPQGSLLSPLSVSSVSRLLATGDWKSLAPLRGFVQTWDATGICDATSTGICDATSDVNDEVTEDD